MSSLLQNWPDAKLLADDMAVVRRKYQKIFDDVLIVFRQRHPELDWAYNDKFRDKDLSHLHQLGIGKRKWPNDGSPSGLYIRNLELENVTGMHSPGLEPPDKSVWILLPDPEDAKQRLHRSAKGILSKEEFPKWEPHAERKWAYISCRIESTEELFDLLVKNKSRGFVERMIDHLESMVKFVRIVDDIVGKPVRK